MSIEMTLSKVGKVLDKAMMSVRNVVKAMCSKSFSGNFRYGHTPMASQYLVLAFDGFMAFLSLFISIHLRIGMDFLDYTPLYILKNMLVFGLVSASIFLWLQTNQAFWRYTTIEDVLPVFLSAALANLLFFPLMMLMNQEDFLPYSILVINVFVLSFSLLIPRFLCRMTYNQKISKIKQFETVKRNVPGAPKVLLVGNISSVEAFCREVEENEEIDFNFDPVGILTLDQAEMGRAIRGIPILGELRDISAVTKELKTEGIYPKQIVLTDKTLPELAKGFIMRYAKSTGTMLLHVLFQYSFNQISE